MDAYLPYIFGALLTFGATAIWVVVRRLYASIDLLFGKLDRQAKELHQMQLAITSIDPSKANMFRAFMRKTAADD